MVICNITLANNNLIDCVTVLTDENFPTNKSVLTGSSSKAYTNDSTRVELQIVNEQTAGETKVYPIQTLSFMIEYLSPQDKKVTVEQAKPYLPSSFKIFQPKETAEAFVEFYEVSSGRLVM